MLSLCNVLNSISFVYLDPQYDERSSPRFTLSSPRSIQWPWTSGNRIVKKGPLDFQLVYFFFSLKSSYGDNSIYHLGSTRTVWLHHRPVKIAQWWTWYSETVAEVSSVIFPVKIGTPPAAYSLELENKRIRARLYKQRNPTELTVRAIGRMHEQWVLNAE